jgi:plastocyanin
MVGSLVVLPKGSTQYNPQPTLSYSYITVKPDFGGDGYDKFVPATIFVNQGDLVPIKVRNTDDMLHGFALTAFNIRNETVASAKSGIPTDTYITPFLSSQPGIYEYFCTIYCGLGHHEMIGYVVVLPQLGKPVLTPVTPAPRESVPAMVAVVSFGMLVTGFVAGLVLSKFIASRR